MKKYMFTETQIKNVVDDILIKRPIKKYIFTETQIKKVVDDTLLSLLREQLNPPDEEEDDFDFLDDPGDDDNVQGLDGENDGEGENDPVFMPGFDPEEPQEQPAPEPAPEVQPINPADRPPVTKKLTESQKIKMRWVREHPGLTDLQMDEHIQFFKERKERLRPYKPYGTIDPQTNRIYINLPEVTAQMEKFPDMSGILTDPQKIKDIQNYSWEQISFYMSRILNLNRVIDDETYIQGDETLEDRFKTAYERWTNPRGQIVNENNTIVYKIESKNESVALGALQICIHEKYSSNAGYNYNAWCTARPEHSRYGSNMYSTYRSDYGAAFYYILDKNRKEDDIYYIAAIDVKSPGHRSVNKPYTLISRKNGDDTNYTWDDIVRIYPALIGKQQLFTYFGTTRKEQANFSLDRITFRQGDDYDFATLSPELQNLYIDSKRHINEVRSFLTLEPAERKLYIDKTVKTDDDYKYRYRCNNHNDPFGILNAINNTKPQDYKYLDYILKEKLGIPMGIAAIKLSIIGSDWQPLMTDVKKSVTLCTMRTSVKSLKEKFKTRYGLLNMANADLIKDLDYFKGTLQSFMTITRSENGLVHRNMLHFQRYNRNINGIPGENVNDYFYFLSASDALTNRKSENYLKGSFFEGADGDAFIREKIATKEFFLLR